MDAPEPSQLPCSHIMWQPDIVGVAHFVMGWIDLLGAGCPWQRLMLMKMVTRTQTRLHQPWRLDRCNHSIINSFIHGAG